MTPELIAQIAQSGIAATHVPQLAEPPDTIINDPAAHVQPTEYWLRTLVIIPEGQVEQLLGYEQVAQFNVAPQGSHVFGLSYPLSFL